MKAKRFYDNPYQQEITARVLQAGKEADGTPYVVLDETVFYPTGGGQPCDLGTINGIAVTDVEEIDGEIRHRLQAPLPDGVTNATGKIDWQRRFDLMQQHTGQHILSASFDELFGAATVGFHLGSERVTIDIKTPDLSEAMAEQAESLANRIVFENRPIVARFVEPDELAELPLRKAPTVTENIRLVIIRDFDYNPCGGTHPAYTGEVGPIKILHWERNKGNTRVDFVCGSRALAEMSKKQQILRSLSRLLTSSEAELPERVARLLAEQKERDQLLQAAEKRLLEAEAQEWLANAESVGEWRVISAVFPGRPMQDLQKLAQQVTARLSSVICLFAATGAKQQFVFASGSDVPLPMNELLKETLAPINGKGGGNPHLAQGGGNGDAEAEQLLQQAVRWLKEKI